MKSKYIIFLFVILFLFIGKLYSINPPKKLIIKEIMPGNNDRLVSDESIVSVHYAGWLFNGDLKVTDYCNAKGKKFDGTRDPAFRVERSKANGGGWEPFLFQIGKNKVIAGWEIGLKNMPEGGKRCLVIPPNLAYGAREIKDVIPANSTLIFEIELMNIENKKE